VTKNTDVTVDLNSFFEYLCILVQFYFVSCFAPRRREDIFIVVYEKITSKESVV